MYEKQCTFTEIYYKDGGDIIKNYIRANSDDQSIRDDIDKEKKAKEAHVTAYKMKLYEEFIAKVVDVLESYEIDEDIIERR